jgi:hypothetical protein
MNPLNKSVADIIAILIERCDKHQENIEKCDITSFLESYEDKLEECLFILRQCGIDYNPITEEGKSLA